MIRTGKELTCYLISAFAIRKSCAARTALDQISGAMINKRMSANPLKRIWPYLILIALVLVVSRSNLSPYTTFGHSAGLDATRLFELDRGVRHGDLYPRWAADMYFGYGSPLLCLYAPLAYFVAEPFHLIGLSMTWALKMSYLVATLLAALGMFLLGRREFQYLREKSDEHQQNLAGLVAATCYILAPYFLVDLYVRAAAAELYGFAIIPWVIYFLALFCDTQDRRCLGAAALAYGCLNFCHNISAMIYSPAILAWILIRFPRKLWIKGGIVLATGLAVGAFFWLPALVLKNAVQSEAHLTTGYFAFDGHFIPFSDLFIPRWGYQPPGDAKDLMSLQLGLAHWAFLILSLAGIYFIKAKRRIIPYLLMIMGAIFFTQPLSRIFWIYVPLLKFVQFPWRFLMIATFAASVLPVFVIAAADGYFGKRAFFACAAALAFASLVLYTPYAKAKYLFLDTRKMAYHETAPAEVHEAIGNPALVTLEQFMNTHNVRRAGITGMASDDFLPADVKRKPKHTAENPLSIIEGGATISDVTWEFDTVEATISTLDPAVVVFESFYFPGVKAHLNGKDHALETKAPEGTILARIPPGKHHLKIFYGNAPIHTIGDVVSALGLIFALGLILFPKRKNAAS